jgi:stearoyl-CoA desaturase (delta-9 desaturase)
LWIRILSAVGLARVLRVAPAPVRGTSRPVDLETVRAVIVNRMHVMRDYSRHVVSPVFAQELRASGSSLSRGVGKLMIRERSLLNEPAKTRLSEALARSQTLNTVHEFRERLQVLWSGANHSNEKLLQHMREWITHAEESGIKVLADYAAALRGYSMGPVRA